MTDKNGTLDAMTNPDTTRGSEVAGVVDVPLAALKPHPRNPRKIRPERLEQLKRNLLADAAMLRARPLIALPDGTVIAGNQRLRAATELGWETIPVAYADLDEERATIWAIRDNRGFGEDDVEITGALLSELAAAGADLDLTGYSSSDIDAILAATRPEPPVDPDDAPPLPEGEPSSQLGEVYELGAHRLMCGDATDALDPFLAGRIDCVLTDPPYGINLDTDFTKRPDTKGKLQGTAQRKYRAVIGDDQPFDAGPFAGALQRVREQFWFGADYYRRALSESDRDGSWLVWDKRNEASDAVVGSGFELIWSRKAHKRDLLRHYFNGALGRDARDRVHPTQKPVPLLSEILDRWTAPGAVVADPFLGSGSTLIACERTGRVCYGVELDPRYCDVIRRRYATFTDHPELAP